MFQIVLPAAVQRAQFIRAMHAAGIGVGVHYPAIHLLSLYRERGFRPGQFPQAERIGRGIATLPLFPAMRDEDVLRVCRESARILRSLAMTADAAAG